MGDDKKSKDSFPEDDEERISDQNLVTEKANEHETVSEKDQENEAMKEDEAMMAPILKDSTE